MPDPLLVLGLSSIALGLLPWVYLVFAPWFLGRGHSPVPSTTETLDYGVLISFVDEASALRESLKALEAAQPPPHEVLVLADGSRGDEVEALQAEVEAHPGWRWIQTPQRRGKNELQARGVQLARSELLVFLDATVRVHPEAPARLLAALQGPGVRLSTGSLRPPPQAQRDQEASYWNLEERLKQAESSRLGTFGVAGGFFACRRREYIPTPREQLQDMATPCLMERFFGGRTVFVPDAIAIEPPRPSVAHWWRARTRIQTRAYASMAILRGWWVGAGGARSLGFLLHKFTRWISIPSLALGSLLLLGRAFGLGAALGGTLAWILSFAFLKLSWDRRQLPWVAMPAYLLSIQWTGLRRALAGASPAVWTPSRGA